MLEDCFESQLAGFRKIKSAFVIGKAGRFQENGVRTGREFESGGGVTVEFPVDENFGGIGFGSNGDCAEAVWGRG